MWLDAGDLTVGPAAPLLGQRPWGDMAALPIDAAAAGNHEFDDGVPALPEAARELSFPLLCANVDAGLPGSAMVQCDLAWLDDAHSPVLQSPRQVLKRQADRADALGYVAYAGTELEFQLYIFRR